MPGIISRPGRKGGQCCDVLQHLYAADMLPPQCSHRSSTNQALHGLHDASLYVRKTIKLKELDAELFLEWCWTRVGPCRRGRGFCGKTHSKG